MLALVCCAVLGLAEAPRELHALPRPPFSRFAVSLQSDAPHLRRTAPAPAPGWSEPRPLELGLELAPIENPWRLFVQGDPDPARQSFEVSGEFEHVMQLYHSSGPSCSRVVFSYSESPCF